MHHISTFPGSRFKQLQQFTDNTIRWRFIITFVARRHGVPMIQPYLAYRSANSRENSGVAGIEFLDNDRMSMHQLKPPDVVFSDLF